MYAELIISKQAEVDKLDKRFEKLLTMRMDGEVTADVFISSSNEIAALTADAPEETSSDYENKITFLKFALEQYTHFDEDRESPDSVLEGALICGGLYMQQNRTRVIKLLSTFKKSLAR